MVSAKDVFKSYPEDQLPLQLPTMYDLPSESPEDPGLPDEFHGLQPQLLSQALFLPGKDPMQWFTGSNLNLYFDLKHLEWYKCPDWFLVLNVPRLYDGWDLRWSYVLWQEKQSPTLVMELLSPYTEEEDLGPFYRESDRIEPNPFDVNPRKLAEIPSKYEVYERYLKVPHYVVYSRYTHNLRYLKLINDQYKEQALQPQNPLIWFEDLNIGLGIWQGKFWKNWSKWLRWCDQEGNWLLTDAEQSKIREMSAEQARQQAEQARQQAEQARQQAEAEKQQAEQARQQAEIEKEQAQQQVQRLAQILKNLGIEINEE